MSKLAVIVLGNRRAGKSTTWNRLFGRTVRTGGDLRQLELSDGRPLSVFLVSASPEERRKYVGDIVNEDAQVVLCSLQYTQAARDSISYFVDNGYALYVQWLNPGHADRGSIPDYLGLINFLLYSGAILSIRDGRDNPQRRVDDIRDFLTGWGLRRRHRRLTLRRSA